MLQKLKELLGFNSVVQSDCPIGDQLAKQMHIDLSWLNESEPVAPLHRMTYTHLENGHWLLDCDSCGFWVFDSEQEVFRHVTVHAKEALNA